MHKTFLNISALLIVVILYACTDKDSNSVSNTNALGDTLKVLFSHSFETNGNFDLNGFRKEGSTIDNVIGDSNDVPMGGGNWSLKFKYNSNPANVLTFTALPLLGNYEKKFVVSFWAKGDGSVSGKRITRVFGKRVDGASIRSFIVDTVWTFRSDTIIFGTSSMALTDSVVTSFTAENGNSNGYLLYDLIKVEEMLK